MDPALASIVVSAIGSTALVVTTAINAVKDVDKAVRNAVAPKDTLIAEKDALIARLTKYIRSLGGDPDDA